MTSKNICPFCLRENELGDAQCIHCGVVLKSGGTNSFSTRRVAKRQSAILEDRARCLNLPPDMVEGDVALFVADAEKPVIVRQGTQMTLGRYGDDMSDPLIDLTPYGAIDRGVSRGHALMTVNDDQITLMDMNSTNGTWLNQEQVVSGKSFVVQNGDRIMLARLRILVCIYSGEQAQEVILKLQSVAGDVKFTTQFLATAVTPFLDGLANLQMFLSDGQGQEVPEIQIISITALPNEEKFTIHLIGIAEAARLVASWLMPWKIAQSESEWPLDANSDMVMEELSKIGEKLIEDTTVPAEAANVEKILPILSALLTNPLILFPD